MPPLQGASGDGGPLVAILFTVVNTIPGTRYKG